MTSDKQPDSTLILGLGNALRGDDGFGPALIAWLDRQELPPSVEVIEGGADSLNLVSLLLDRQRVIVVDAANLGDMPGAWRRFTPATVHLKSNAASLSLHAAGLTEALALAATLKVLPPEVIIYGVQPAHLEWNTALSAEVQAVVPIVGNAVLQEIVNRPLGGGGTSVVGG